MTTDAGYGGWKLAYAPILAWQSKELGKRLPGVSCFLQDRRQRSRKRCEPGEIYCVKCRVLMQPAGDMADYLPTTTTSGERRAYSKHQSGEGQPVPLAVMELAQHLGIHPAIVTGRMRHESRNYRLLSHFVGNRRGASAAAEGSSTRKTESLRLRALGMTSGEK